MLAFSPEKFLAQCDCMYDAYAVIPLVRIAGILNI